MQGPKRAITLNVMMQQRKTVLALAVLLLCAPGCDQRAAVPMSQKALESLVMGQTTDVVVKKLGPPTRADQTYGLNGSPDGIVWWFFDDILQESPDKPKRQAWLVITGGRVVQVKQN